MGQRHLISTPVTRRRCGCGRAVLVALAEGEAVAVDPAQVAPLAELGALMTGLRSFDLVTFGGRRELVWRDRIRIGRRENPVLLQHPCAHPVNVEDPTQMWKKQKGSPPGAPSTPGAGLPVTAPF